MEEKKINDHLTAIVVLWEKGLNGAGVIGAYHKRRVAPLMKWVLCLFEMVPDARTEGTVLSIEVPSNSEVARRINCSIEPLIGSSGNRIKWGFPVQGCPPMRLKPGFVEFVSLRLFPKDRASGSFPADCLFAFPKPPYVVLKDRRVLLPKGHP